MIIIFTVLTVAQLLLDDETATSAVVFFTNTRYSLVVYIFRTGPD